MSSLRNAVARRPHKERSQTKSREKWGLLEKHKDYSLRAADYNLKQKKLNILSQKSRDRNPDEFAFGMVRETAGRRGQNREKGLSDGAVRLLKTQDAGYLRVVTQRTRREMQRVEEEIELQTVMRGGLDKTVKFGEEGRLVKRRRVSGQTELDGVESQLQTVQSSLGRQLQSEPVILSTTSVPQVRSGLMDKATSKPIPAKNRLAQLKADRKRRQRVQEARLAKLDLLRKRQKDVMAAAEVLEMQRLKMANAAGGTNASGVKFRMRERKK